MPLQEKKMFYSLPFANRRVFVAEKKNICPEIARTSSFRAPWHDIHILIMLLAPSPAPILPSNLNSLDSLVLCQIVRLLPVKTGVSLSRVGKHTFEVLREEIKSICQAQRLQRFWRYRSVHHSTRNILSGFLETAALSPADMRSMSFEALCLHLRNSAQVIKPFRRLLVRISSVSHQMLSDQDMRGAFEISERRNARFFLATFMIVYHPNNAIDPAHPLAASLRAAAADFIRCFEKVVAQLSSAHGSFQSFPRAVMLEFMHACASYIHVFTAWKEEDARTIVDRIYAALRALAEARLSVIVNEGAGPGDRLLLEIDVQIRRLREKLVNMAQMQALEEFDRYSEDLSGQAMFAVINPTFARPDVVNPEEGDSDAEVFSDNAELNPEDHDSNELNPEDEEDLGSDDDELSPEDHNSNELNPEDEPEDLGSDDDELSPEVLPTSEHSRGELNPEDELPWDELDVRFFTRSL
jgi:hypothetical protein